MTSAADSGEGGMAPQLRWYRWVSSAALLAVALFGLAWVAYRWLVVPYRYGSSRLVWAETEPGGERVALVISAYAFDDANESLWLQDSRQRLFVRQLSRHWEHVVDVEWSPAGDRIAVLRNDGLVLVVDVKTFAEFVADGVRAESLTWEPGGEALRYRDETTGAEREVAIIPSAFKVPDDPCRPPSVTTEGREAAEGP